VICQVQAMLFGAEAALWKSGRAAENFESCALAVGRPTRKS